MKQILQSLKTGNVQVSNIPVPSKKNGQLLIKTSHTLVSTGTERMLVEFGKAGWIEKARLQPDKVRMVIDKVKADGLQPTLESIFNKLDQPLPLGYCNVGTIVDKGTGTNDFSVGDRVISNGRHAEFVSVPVNLCAKVPDTVSDKDAAFTVLSSISLQSIRLAKPTLGENVVVIGLGLIGLLTVQLLKAQGCRVLGLDFDPVKTSLAQKFGADVVNLSTDQDPIKVSERFSRGKGVDAVIIAAATKSNDPITQAANMCRKRGRIVLVGVSGLELSRDIFFKKELTFQVSASYGPGRYDPNYEEKGNDYPIGYVRWTEQRNFEAILDMMAEGKLNLKPLVSHQFKINEAEKAYKIISEEKHSLGILLEYPSSKTKKAQRTIELRKNKTKNKDLTIENFDVSFLGAGNYATSTLIPAFKTAGSNLLTVASSSGVSGFHAARKFGFELTTTDTDTVFEDPKSKVVVITTRHDSHADLVVKGLNSRKHLFVEKPLCLTISDLNKIESVYKKMIKVNDTPPILMVGFNRRFAPQIQKIKSLLNEVGDPKSFVLTINAGVISPNHWINDMKIGGGRIIGEVCHFIDLLRFLAGSKIYSWSCATMESGINDTVSITIKFLDGSLGTINYLTNGHKAYPKETLEIFSAGRVLKLNNYRELSGFGWPGFKKMRLWRQDKGQKACVKAFLDCLYKNDLSPISIDEILEVSRVSIDIAHQ